MGQLKISSSKSAAIPKLQFTGKSIRKQFFFACFEQSHDSALKQIDTIKGKLNGAEIVLKIIPKIIENDVNMDAREINWKLDSIEKSKIAEVDLQLQRI